MDEWTPLRHYPQESGLPRKMHGIKTEGNFPRHSMYAIFADQLGRFGGFNVAYIAYMGLNSFGRLDMLDAGTRVYRCQ